MKINPWVDSSGTIWLTQFQITLFFTIKMNILSLSEFQTIVFFSTPCPVNSVTVSLDFYPAAPNFELPTFDNLHLGLLQPRL